MREVLVQLWTEHEDSWPRPDGHSIHLSKRHLNEYSAEEERKRGQLTPSGSRQSYSWPDDKFYMAEISEELYNEIEAEGGSKWFPQNKGPEPI